MRYLFEEYAFDTDRRELHRGTDAVSGIGLGNPVRHLQLGVLLPTLSTSHACQKISASNAKHAACGLLQAVDGLASLA